MQINHQVHLFLSVDDTRVIMNWIQGGTSANVHFGEGQISYTVYNYTIADGESR